MRSLKKRKWSQRLRDQCGATILEILCALLLVAMTSLLFSKLIGTANTINIAADKVTRELEQELTITESSTASGSHGVPGRIRVTASGPGGSYREINVYLYTSGPDSLIAYEIRP